MKRKNVWTKAILALAVAGLCAGAALAANGDKNDPLVTLSYLEETAIPQVVEQVEETAAARQQELEEQFADQLARYKKEVTELADSLSAAGDTASYTLVTLTAGQTMKLEVGCEVMLRVGTVKVEAGTNPALIDISTGGSLNKGASLTKNHLYMATIADRSLVPTADTVKLLVRGGYTVV